MPMGLECKLYYGTSGTSATTEATNVKDVKLDCQAGSADITTRAAGGWRVKRATLKEGSVEFEVKYIKGESFFEALKTAFLEGGTIALVVGDDAGEGLDADFSITNFGIDQSLEEGVWVNCTAEISLDETTPRVPSWKTVTAPPPEGG